MAVFRPTTGTNTWAVDVAQASDNFTGSASPANYIATGQTSIAASTVTVASWVVADNVSWSLVTGGWSNPGGITQVRNLFGDDTSVSIAYKIQTSPGATGNVTNHQGANGPDAGRWFIQTFKEVAAAGNNAGSMVSQRRLKSMVGGALVG